MTTTYWSPALETAAPEEIQLLQQDGLRRTLRTALRVPHYRDRLAEAGVDVAAVRTAEDLAGVPFMDKAQLRELQPWGVQAARRADIVRLNATTGTTGLPCHIAFTRQDLDNIGELGARNLTAMGVRSDDIAWQCYGYGLWIGGSSLDRAYEQVGVTAFPAGPGRTTLAVERLRDLGVTVISCTPTFALLLVERAREAGIDPAADWRLRIGIFGGETMSPAAMARLSEAMPPGFRPHNTYGTTELGGPFVAGTCAYSREQGTFHVWSDHYLIEIIDPESGEPVTEPDVLGELVVTTLQREGSPMVRWRTRDLTSWAPDAYDCPCGRRGHPKISWISGRTDDVLKVRGSLVMPSQVEDVVSAVADIGAGWQLVVDKDPDGLRATEATVVVEIAHALRETAVPELSDRLSDRLGIRLPVVAAGDGELPRYEGKARRVLTVEEFGAVAPLVELDPRTTAVTT
ncbi:phenylacetate--CoA ligase family protein [Amycolatopsis alkalitolerans]|uniref:Phenylacetate--CoA ligase n=1 Tax=Amycolatopsis alkalitolerans TaxID=2547244 RepID=A0A5C4M2K7_9PSEU|nr:AMP-binding protein [Amycolatopsis alkalitolerans]TNC25130.1 phenylacetate--CoA ligase [Amycolatopsis alkalitolerans]